MPAALSQGRVAVANTLNPGRKRALNDRQTERLCRLIQKRPDATLKELRTSLGVKISIAALDRAIRRLAAAYVRRPTPTFASRL